MKICPKCEINFVINDKDEFCSVCNTKNINNKIHTDNNKSEMEKYLLPYLHKSPQKTIDALTTKEFSYEILRLRIPLLIKCQNLGKDCCKKEIAIGNSKVFRYYLEPYDINGIKYHICSQWSNSETEQSKQILNLFKYIK